MVEDPPNATSECQFRFENSRCIFVDGHPGAHVCIGAHSSHVAIRGPGEIPDATYLAEQHALPSDRGEQGIVSAEDVWGEWTGPMVRRLLDELHEAGAASPRDWMVNFHRLRSERNPP